MEYSGIKRCPQPPLSFSPLVRCSTGSRNASPSASARRVRPTTPAAGSAWPMNDLAAVNTSGTGRMGGLLPPPQLLELPDGLSRTAAAAPTSMGSPREVPVPCICRLATSQAPCLPAASAARTTSCWLGPLGAVRLLERPSWLTALPRMTSTAAEVQAAA